MNIVQRVDCERGSGNENGGNPHNEVLSKLPFLSNIIEVINSRELPVSTAVTSD
jgi:hypothetical protein